MAFRRSAVRSRLAPPPHHRGRAAYAAAAPLLFLLRTLLAVALLGFVPAAPKLADPALALALAAGALCQGEAPDGLPAEHAHEHCLACRGTSPSAGLAEAPALPMRLSVAGASIAASARTVPAVGWAAYASRAPPGLAG